MLHELPKDGSSIKTIKDTKYEGEPLYNIIGECLPIDFWKRLKLEDKIRWDYLSSLIMEEATRVIILEKGEKLLAQWIGKNVTSEEIILEGNLRKIPKRENGLLLLSTRKIRWIKTMEIGFFNKKIEFELGKQIALENIRGISGETGDSRGWSSLDTLMKAFSIVDSNGENKFLLKFAFLETFKPIIQKAIDIRNEEIDADKKKQRVHFMLDFTFLKKYMKKGGLTMQVLKCPNCQAKIDFPKSGSQITCSYCGNNIFAQDVFEKVKSLLE